MIDVLFTRLSQPLPEASYQRYLQLLPLSMREKNERFVRWQDRHANLLGKILLVEALQKYGWEPDCLGKVKYNAYGKPFFEDAIDFSISHSEEYVLCAVARDIRVGVDIEKVKPARLDDFKNTMTDIQWQQILTSADALRTFYRYWVIKESVIKADARGLSIPLETIHIAENKVIISDSNQEWFIHNLDIDSSYCTCLAVSQNTDQQDINIIQAGDWL